MEITEKIRGILAGHKLELRKEYKVKEIGVFGSYIKNKQKQVSDIDIFVDFREMPTLIKFINLENYLSDLLGAKVDFVIRGALKPNIGKIILDEVIFA
jgi:hypothetical protein